MSDDTDDDDDDDGDDDNDEDYIKEEDDDEDEDEEEEAEKEGIREEPPSKIPKKMFSHDLAMSDDEEEQPAEGSKASSKPPKAMDQNACVSDLQQQNIRVKRSSNTTHQRVYDKRNYCLYCEKPYAKIARHLTQKHCNKTEVAKALMHNKGSSMRKLLLSKVSNMGNYHHNCSVLSTGKGQIIPKRQATYPSTAADYLPCKFCFAMFVRTDIWRHHKHCKSQVKEDGPVRRKFQTTCSMLMPTNTSISAGFKRS